MNAVLIVMIALSLMLIMFIHRRIPHIKERHARFLHLAHDHLARFGQAGDKINHAMQAGNYNGDPNPYGLPLLAGEEKALFFNSGTHNVLAFLKEMEHSARARAASIRTSVVILRGAQILIAIAAITSTFIILR